MGSCYSSGTELDHFRCHLAEVVALSSNGDCGATPLSVCLVATQLVTCTCGATCPRGFLSSITLSQTVEEKFSIVTQPFQIDWKCIAETKFDGFMLR